MFNRNQQIHLNRNVEGPLDFVKKESFEEYYVFNTVLLKTLCSKMFKVFFLAFVTKQSYRPTRKVLSML